MATRVEGSNAAKEMAEAIMAIFKRMAVKALTQKIRKVLRIPWAMAAQETRAI